MCVAISIKANCIGWKQKKLGKEKELQERVLHVGPIFYLANISSSDIQGVCRIVPVTAL